MWWFLPQAEVVLLNLFIIICFYLNIEIDSKHRKYINKIGYSFAVGSFGLYLFNLCEYEIL